MGGQGKPRRYFRERQAVGGLELRARESMVFRGPVLPESKAAKPVWLQGGLWQTLVV